MKNKILLFLVVVFGVFFVFWVYTQILEISTSNIKYMKSCKDTKLVASTKYGLRKVYDCSEADLKFPNVKKRINDY